MGQTNFIIVYHFLCSTARHNYFCIPRGLPKFTAIASVFSVGSARERQVLESVGRARLEEFGLLGIGFNDKRRISGEIDDERSSRLIITNRTGPI